MGPELRDAARARRETEACRGDASRGTASKPVMDEAAPERQRIHGSRRQNEKKRRVAAAPLLTSVELMKLSVNDYTP